MARTKCSLAHRGPRPIDACPCPGRSHGRQRLYEQVKEQFRCDRAIGAPGRSAAAIRRDCGHTRRRHKTAHCRCRSVVQLGMFGTTGRRFKFRHLFHYIERSRARYGEQNPSLLAPRPRPGPERHVAGCCCSNRRCRGTLVFGVHSGCEAKLRDHNSHGVCDPRLFPAVYLWKLITTPAKMDAEARKERDALRQELDGPHEEIRLVLGKLMAEGRTLMEAIERSSIAGKPLECMRWCEKVEAYLRELDEVLISRFRDGSSLTNDIPSGMFVANVPQYLRIKARVGQLARFTEELATPSSVSSSLSRACEVGSMPRCRFARRCRGGGGAPNRA